MSVNLPDDLDVQVRTMAATLGVTRSEVIRRAIQHELETEHLDLTQEPDGDLPRIRSIPIEEEIEEPEGVPG